LHVRKRRPASTPRNALELGSPQSTASTTLVNESGGQLASAVDQMVRMQWRKF
jgi:hypothetical protein